MMLEISTRLLIAYGLIVAMLLGAVAVVLWSVRNSWQRRDARDRARLAKRYQQRDEAAAAGRAATDRTDAQASHTIGTTR